MKQLKKGDTVGLIAPSCGAKEADLPLLEKLFEQLELKVIYANNLTTSFRYMAGSDEVRAKEFNRMVKNSKVKALFCLRGGAGSTRMLDKIDFALLKANPKPIIGLSDSTALQNAAIKLTNNPSLTGFLPLYEVKTGKINEFMVKELKKTLFEKKHEISSGKCLKSGKAEGKIVGGCLSVFNLLCGTRYFPNLKGKILLLEDVGEKTYKIDLWLQQLKQQPHFDELKGIIFGKFSDCMVKDKSDGTIADCINDFIKDLKIPVIGDFDYGHIAERHIIPLGIKVKMCATTKDCTLNW